MRKYSLFLLGNNYSMGPDFSKNGRFIWGPWIRKPTFYHCGVHICTLNMNNELIASFAYLCCRYTFMLRRFHFQISVYRTVYIEQYLVRPMTRRSLAVKIVWISFLNSPLARWFLVRK